MELAFAVVLVMIALFWVATVVVSASSRWIRLRVSGRCHCRTWEEDFVIPEQSTWRGALFELPVECPDCLGPVVTDPPTVERFNHRGKPPYSRIPKE